ncbi:MAG: B12-binding domain-containing radical SAM protein, partial [Halobacteria archaeon]|nr:B12-binding domain-containing radical SAM protein [Halobacteria archaeon]
GVQKNLNTLRKGITLEQTRKAVRAAKEVGLMVSTPFLFGIPGETFEEGLKTIDFAIELKPDLANFHALTAFPGTHLYEHLDQYGRVSGKLNDYTYQGAAFVPYTMSREQIHELRQIAFRRFYSRPSFLVRRLLQIRTWKDCQVALSGMKSLFWMWSKKNLFSRAKGQTAVRSG